MTFVIDTDGYKVFAVDLSKDRMLPLCEELNERYSAECVIPVRLDVTNVQQCHEVAEMIKHKYGTVSVLVNNAGILSRAKVEETTPEEWVNLKTSMLRC